MTYLALSIFGFAAGCYAGKLMFQPKRRPDPIETLWGKVR